MEVSISNQNEEKDDFYRKMPKIELHAHINGSISPRTMAKLITLKQAQDPSWVPPPTHDTPNPTHFNRLQKNSIKRTFQMFDLIHEIVQTEDAAYMTTYDVIEEFAADNVRYLELRTTPRDIPSTGLTKRSYIDAVIKAIQTASPKFAITVRLLLAIDRRTSVQDAMDTVTMATEYRDRAGGLVVGIDFSGDPTKGDANDFIPVFKAARAQGLKLALHLAEIESQRKESLTVLEQVPPDRIGHGTFIHGGSSKMTEIIEKNQIPLELCLTSNIVVQSVPTLEDHHFSHWYSRKHPLVICTDDKGVFSTSLSEELSLAAETFSLSCQQVWELSYNAINYIFSGDDVKDQLRETLMAEKTRLFDDSVS